MISIYPIFLFVFVAAYAHTHVEPPNKKNFPLEHGTPVDCGEIPYGNIHRNPYRYSHWLIHT